MPPTLHMSGNPEADAVLSKEPLALLIGMVLDQQVPLEWAFASPAELKRRLRGSLDAAAIASMDPDALATAFTTKPALHRYPGSMAKRVQELCRAVADEYGNDPAKVWTGAASGDELLARIRALPGFGERKAKIFVAFCGKQLGVRPSGWEQASAPFSDPGSRRSVADVVDAESLTEVRAFKQQMKSSGPAAGP